jgi:hypothetical protein
MRFRIYCGNSVISEDLFEEYDNSIPYYDDYEEVEIPDIIVEYLTDV